MVLSISIILVLLLCSAFFSGAETALTAASRPAMHQLEQNGDKRAAIVNALRERKEQLIGSLLLGNNLVNIMASSLATGVLIALFGNAGIAYATLGMTLAILIFAEILPKTYAFKDPNATARAIAPTVRIVVMLLSPLTRLINGLVNIILSVFGANFRSERGFPSSTELRGAIDLHAGEDGSVRHERAMLRSVLELAEVQVGEIVVHRKNVTAIDIGLPPETIVEQMLASPHTRVPLWKGEPDNIVGVLHGKELFRAMRAAGGDVSKLDVAAIVSAPWFIPEYTLLLDQLHAFRERREHFALVVDEYGILLGIVTLEDILEEIVGDISDEHDTVVRGVRPQPDGSYLIQGSVTIRDLNREFEWGLPDEDASTVAGLILHESRRIPDVGQAFIFHGVRFEIMRRQRHQITQIKVTPPPPAGR